MIIRPTPKEIRDFGSQNLRPDIHSSHTDLEILKSILFENAVHHVCSSLGNDYKQVGNHFEIYYDENPNGTL